MMIRFRILITILGIGLTSCIPSGNVSEPDLEFIVAADWRYKATEAYRTPEHFLGALQAIKRVGQGDFMISPGDLEPVSASHELIVRELGEDYPWYPVIGNHELEDSGSVPYLRELNRGGNSLPNIVRKGPVGSEETTYSFDWGNCHFVVLNVYFDGQSDVGGHDDGSIVPELLAWLEEDLAANRRKFTFVFAHVPLMAMPDMDNGRIRHQGEVLDRNTDQMFDLYSTLVKYGVDAYFCGDTHNCSLTKMNDLWQVDVGHARGLEELFPKNIYRDVEQLVEENGLSALDSYFEARKYKIKKALYYMDLTAGVYYKSLEDQPALEAFRLFYRLVKEDFSRLDPFDEGYRHRFKTTKSTFIKVQVYRDEVQLDVYRDDAHGGEYSLTKSVVLN